MHDRITRSFDVKRYPAILGGKSFSEYLGSIPILKDEMEVMFTEMVAQNKKYLIIDLRNNPGGNDAITLQLLYFLTKKEHIDMGPITCRDSPLIPLIQHCGNGVPTVTGYTFYPPENVFDALSSSDYALPEKDHGMWNGKVFVITDNDTFSSATDLAAYIKDYKLGTIVGQPTGGMATSFGDALFFELPHTKLRGSVSYKFFVRPSGDMKVGPVVPDQKLTERDYQHYGWSPDTEILYILDRI